MDPLSSLALQLAMLEAAIGVGGQLEDAKLKLFTNSPILNRSTVVGDLTEADFSGYTDIDPYNFTSVFIDTDSVVKAIGPSAAFELTATTVTNTVTGWYITNTAGTGLLLASYLPEPISLTSVGQGLLVLPAFPWGA